jgi:hypothetical protein
MVYLEKPNTAIEFKSGESAKHKTRFTAAEMQGWRINMVSSLRFVHQTPTTYHVANIIKSSNVGGRTDFGPRL